jgi:hypothetical protein
MLTCIIRLQAVVKIITNETARALNLLTKQSTKMCSAIYQNRLALDYLLASEGGVCGRFNLSNCCLQIDDEGKVVEEITPNEKNRPRPSPDLERLEPWRMIWRMVFNFWGIQNPHKCYAFDFRGLPGFALPGTPDRKVCLQPH